MSGQVLYTSPAHIIDKSNLVVSVPVSWPNSSGAVPLSGVSQVVHSLRVMTGYYRLLYHIYSETSLSGNKTTSL